VKYNYHTHTFRCHHANGLPEEYIKRAVENGLERMGFSEHFPYRFPDGHQSGYRLPEEEIGAYFEELQGLREAYKDKIEIRIGFEMEYYPAYFQDMLEKATSYGAEYLILGQHFLGPDMPPVPERTINKTQSEANLEKYVSDLVAGIETGVFTYVAHPDIMNFVGDPEIFKSSFRRICCAAKETDTPLEVNFLGLRENRNYPNMLIWELIGQEKAPVTFGFDAHDVPSAFDADSLEKAKSMVQRYGLNYIGEPVLRPLRK